MTIRIAPLVASFVCAGFLGCAQAAEPAPPVVPQLDASVHGKSIVYSPAQNFDLTLDSYSDAGYQWECALSDSGVVTLKGNPTYRQKSPGPVIPGGLSVATFHFCTKDAGVCVLRLIEHQKWMKDVPPRATVEFTIEVRR